MSIQETLRYGAIDLKESYNRNLGIALLLSIVLHLLLIGLYGILTKKALILTPPIHLPDSGPILISDLITPPVPAVTPPSGPASGGSGPLVEGGILGGIKADVGTPIPSAIDTNDFVAITEVPIASPIGGNGIGDPSLGNGGIGGNGGGPSFTPDNGVSIPKGSNDADLDPGIYVHVEQEPTWDAHDLQRRVKYPEIARRNNIEGMVVVQALIDRNGKVVRTMIVSSDNKVFEASAVEAVTQTVFTPAVQNKVPVAVWIQVPILYQLQ